MKFVLILALALGTSLAQAVTINAVYFGQTHVLKATDSYFGLVANREALIKVHVTDPAAPASPAVTATLTLTGQPTLVLPLTGPATLPTSIPDGLGVVQHSFSNTFTGYIPALYVKKGLQITVNAGTASTSLNNLDIGAPTKVIMTMFDVQYFADTNDDYPANTFAELEAKWPVADLEVRRLGHVVFPELVIPPRADVGAEAVRIKSKTEYELQTGLTFDGEQAAALEWNGALKRAAGRSGRWSLYYVNVYNAFAGGQAGGFAGVGSGTDVGILHHELGHALSLPHWGSSASYPYKGDMHGIQAPSNFNETHAGPAWGFDLRTRAFIPPTVQANNVGGKPVGTYKVDPMQGGGEGWQEPAYRMNHFSDYSVNQMRDYLHSHVVVWNSTLNSWAQWNQTTGDYTTTVTNNGVQFPTTRDTSVISIMASMSGAKPSVNMVYPPIGPYTSGLIQLFDPTIAADRTAANTKYDLGSGCDYCVRVVQGGVQKTYIMPASALTSQALTNAASLETEAINLPASSGTVTKIELLSTPNVEDVGLPASPQVLSTWAPLLPATATFESPPTSYGSTAVTMKAVEGEVAFGYTGTVEYQFTETSGNPGATSSTWQTSRIYTDTGLTPGTQYSYTVSMRTVSGTLSSATSAAASAVTYTAPATTSVTVDDTQQFSLQSGNGTKDVAGLGTFDAGSSDKLVVVISTEDANNGGIGYVYSVRYNGKVMTQAIQEDAGVKNGTAAIFYLDNPGSIGSGTIQVSAENPNGGIGCAYALSNTMPGFGLAINRTGTAANSVGLTTAGDRSVVIAVIENSGNPNNSGIPTATTTSSSLLTQASSGEWGSQWGGHASGYRILTAPTAITPTFSTNTGSGYSINIAAVEFPAQPPLANRWIQTAGGAQLWTTTSNWDDGTVPNPASGATMDFSTVNIVANTTLNLGANRIARLWKFGDTSGSQRWIVGSGNTLTLAGTTPGFQINNGTTQVDSIIAGTAGLEKTGAGNLTLTGANTYTGPTTITAGTLQIGNGGTIGSLAAASAINNNAAMIISRSNTITQGTAFASVIAGTGTLTKSGAGTLILTGANTYTGDTTISAGTLQIGNGGTTGALSASSAITNNAALVFNRSNGVIQGSGFADAITGTGSLTNIGTGTVTLNSANTYTGLTTVNAGAFKVLHANALGTTAAGTVVDGATAGSATNARLELEGGMNVTGEALTISGAGNYYGALTSTSGSNTWAGNVTIGAAGTRLGSSAGSTLTVSGVINSGITETGLIIRTQDLTATVILLGTNTYLGDTTVLVGKLQLNGGNNRLPITTKLLMGSSSTNPDAEFDLNGRNQEVAGLAMISGATAANNSINNSSLTLSTLTVNTASPSTFSSILTGNLALVKSGTNTLTLSGMSATATSNYSGKTTIDEGTLAITTVSPSLTGGLAFGASAGSTTTGTLDLSAVSATFAGAASVVTNSATANTITIGTGKTLTLNGGLTIGYDAGSGLTGALPSLLTAAGAGTLSVNGTAITIGVNQAGAANQAFWNDATLDVTALGAFHANVANFNIGVGTQTQGPGTVLLSNTANTILATTLTVGDTGGNNGRGPGTLMLGTGTNLIQADTLQIGRGKSSGNGFVKFASQTSGSPGTVTIVNKAGSGAATIIVGDNGNSPNSAGGASGTLDLRGHVATVTAGTLTIGKNSMTSNSGNVTGTVSFDAGTFTVNNIAMASKAGASSGAANAILEIGGGSFTLNTGGSFSLASQASGGSANGTLNITGGTLTSHADIVDGGGMTTTTITLNGGTLDMTGKNIGGATPINTLNFQSGTLRNVASINGTGGLTKTTTGTLTLSGTNGYTGVTNVTAGVISLGSVSALGTTAGNTIVASGGEIFAGTAVANSTIAEPFTIAGTGVTGAVHIGNAITGITFSGAITLSADARIQSDGSTSSSFTGGINTNDFALTFNGSGTVVVGTLGISGSGSVIKNTGGTLTFSAANTYTGNTVVNAGTLALADNAQLKFVLGSASGSNNNISGAGTVTLNGDFVIDTSAADALASGSWTLENVSILTGPYGSTFTVIGFTDAGSNKWTKVNGTKLYTFDETTGILTLTPAASYSSWIDGFFPGETSQAIIGTDADPDKDGIANGVEMVIGGNPKLTMDTNLLPTIELVTNPVSNPAIPAGNYMLFTYRRSDLAITAGISTDCETNANLVGTWTAATGAPGVVIQVDDDFTFTPPAAANTDRVRVYVPRAENGKGFGRLKVLIP